MEYLNSSAITFLLGSTCWRSRRSFIRCITVTFQLFNNLIISMKAKTLLINLIIFLLISSLLVYKLVKINYVSSLTYQGQHIRIDRGPNNIAEVHAPSFPAALYGWGYAAAEDRLFQMSFRRAVIQGRLAEYLGEKALDIDKMFRQINLRGWASRSAERFLRENATEYHNLKAYAEGVNDYVKTLTFRPMQFYMIGMGWEEWTVDDIIASFKLIKWSLSFGMMEEYFRSALLRNMTKEEVDAILPYEHDAWLNGEHSTLQTIVKDHEIPKDILEKTIAGEDPDNFRALPVEEMLQLGFFQYLDVNERASNSWVISGNHTESGHPLLCNDPHLDSSLPTQWHQIKVFYLDSTGKEVYLIGAALVGGPFFIGKSPYISISMTTNVVDSQDLFKQQIKDQKYLLDGEWRPLKKRNETIKVKNSEPIQYIVYETHRGPIISHVGSKGYLYKVSEPISLCWSGFTDAQHKSLTAYIHLPELKQYSQIVPYLHANTDYGPQFNLIYSTIDGHIGYYAIGMIPQRRHPHSGMYIKDGTQSENDWIGFVQGSDKLHLEDPERGYIVSANNKAASKAYLNGLVDVSIYTGRADRIQKLIRDEIASGRKLNKDFMKKIQLDTVDSMCLELVSKLQAKLATGNSNYKFLYSIFENFDCDFYPNSTTASFYTTFIQNLYEELHPQTGEISKFNLFNLFTYHNNIYNFMLKQHTEEDFKKLNNSMFDAMRELRTFFKSQNPSNYKYGELHRDLMVHRPFSNSPLIKSWFEYETVGFGNQNTPNVGAMYRFHDKDYRTNHRANIRLIMSHHEDSEWIVDGGTSEKFYSQFYKDQTELFMSGRYIMMDPSNRTQAVY